MEPKQEQLTPEQRLTIYLHQDNLMWSLLQTIGVVQIAALSAAYTLRSEKWPCLVILILGLFLTLLIFFLFKRTELGREKVVGGSPPDLAVDREWFAPLRGSEIAALLVALLVLADVALGIAVLKGCIH